MVDSFTKTERSRIMSSVKSKNTNPEKIVRSLLFRLGYRFRLHSKLLPGEPDIVLPRFKTVIEVRGCFWHRHPRCKRASMPHDNNEYWKKKFERTKQRDRKNKRDLKKLGWRLIVIWECELRNVELLTNKLSEISKR